jgi:hypothetical protein
MNRNLWLRNMVERKDKFLNMTLDFFMRVLWLLSILQKQWDLPIDVEIYDSQETKNSSAIASIVSNNYKQQMRWLGLYQSNAETTAQLLNK